MAVEVQQAAWVPLAAGRLGGLAARSSPVPVHQVQAVEVAQSGSGHSYGALIAGLAPVVLVLGAQSRSARRRARGRAGAARVLLAAQGDEIKFAPAKGSGEEEVSLPPMSLQERARALAESLPGLARLTGSVVVIKYGGAAMVKSPERTIRDVALLRTLGLKPVLVHGGGPEINSWLAKVGIEPKFAKGLRVTDEATMEVVAMVLMGKLNKSIVATMAAAGVPAVGLSGVDGGLLQAKRVDDEELGYVGDVTGVKVDVLQAALDKGLVPVVATVACDKDGHFLNINADPAAAAIAGALDAREFVLMTDVPGLLRDVKDPNSLIGEININEAVGLIDQGIVAGGMIPKVKCCMEALKAGVRSTHIIDGRRPHALIEELLGSQDAGKQGTTIFREV